MNKQNKYHNSTCPIAYSLDIIGDRWAMLIIRDIVFRGKSSFGDFVNSKEGIATNVLTVRLKRLEQQGIISKEQDTKKLSKYIYRLTDVGLNLLPLLVEMILFAGKHDKQTAVSKEFYNKIKSNKRKFISDSMKNHEKSFNEF